MFKAWFPWVHSLSWSLVSTLIVAWTPLLSLACSCPLACSSLPGHLSVESWALCQPAPALLRAVSQEHSAGRVFLSQITLNDVFHWDHFLFLFGNAFKNACSLDRSKTLTFFHCVFTWNESYFWAKITTLAKFRSNPHRQGFFSLSLLHLFQILTTRLSWGKFNS